MRLSYTIARFLVPAAWLVTLGFQAAFAAMTIEDTSQIMAGYFEKNPRPAPSETWKLICDSSNVFVLLSWALWFAAIPRVFTAIVCGREFLPSSQSRLVRGILLVALLLLTFQLFWGAVLFGTHATGASFGNYVFTQGILRFETRLFWRQQFIAVSPLVLWIVALITAGPRGRNLQQFAGACWGAVVYVEFNVANALGHARMPGEIWFETEVRFDEFGRYAGLAVVLLAFVIEYQQVWRDSLAGYSQRQLPETMIPNP